MLNLKLAFRTLFRTPFVTAVAVLSLALGIGANSAFYSMFEQMLLRPLPVRDPSELVNLVGAGPKQGSMSCNQAGECESVFSYPMFRDLERGQTVFTGLAAHRTFGANIAYRTQTTNASGMFVSGSYFPVLGIQPALGRLFGPADDESIGGHPVAVLSHAYWETQLGGDRAVVNSTISVNGTALTIVGVAPAGFTGTTLGVRPQVYVPITMRRVLVPGPDDFQERRGYWVYLFARRKPGVSIEQAAVALNGVFHPIITDVEAPLQRGMSEQTMTRFKAKEITLEEGRQGQSSVRGEARMPLTLLFATTAIVLLIACANIANLLLARGANRSMEMAVRLSLGATRWQIVRQLLLEACLLALLGGAASLLVAHWTFGLVRSFLPAEGADTLDLVVGLPVVAFAAGLSVATGLIFGMFPALHSTRPELISVIRANTGQLTGARAATRFRMSLITAQIALSMALLISAGLFIRSLTNVSRVDLGLQADGIVTFAISPESNKYDPARSRALFTRVEEEVARLPGVTSVVGAFVPVLAGDDWSNSVSVEGFQADADTDVTAWFNGIGPGFFRTLGIPMLAGRDFTPADVSGAGKVAIVNEAFAKKFNMGRDVVGKHMSVGRRPPLDIQIVGFVRDAKYSSVKDTTPPQYFMPHAQDTTLGALNFYVRTELPVAQTIQSIRAVMTKLDPNLPVEDLKTLPDQVRETVMLDRMISTLSAAFAALATLLAAVGLYGVLAYTVAQRTREIGVRMALGADAGRVRAMVLKQVGLMTLIGGLLGIAGALALGRAAQSLLFGLSGHDPGVVAVSALAVTLVAFGAGIIPALRASRVDPMQALRYE